MKTILLALAIALLATAARADLKILSAQYREADSFKRISEHLTGQESQGRYAIYRTDAQRRSGFYISLKADRETTLATLATLSIQYVRPGSQDIEEATIPAPAPSKKRLLIGLTDLAWADHEIAPAAWKITLKNAAGAPIDTAQSFLWSE